MSKRNFLVGAIAVFILACSVVLFLFSFEKPSAGKLVSALPAPPSARPYVLLETREGHYPSALASFLTEGPYATMHKGTSRNLLVSLAPLAQDVGMLVVNEEIGFDEVYVTMRFAPHEMKKLEQGVLPESWKNVFGALLGDDAPTVEAGAEKGAWEVWSRNMDAPLFYCVRDEIVLLAADKAPFEKLMLAARENATRRHIWRDEPAWDSHLEFGTGRLALPKGDDNPIKLQVAWRYLQNGAPDSKAGEARWSIDGLKTLQKASLMLTAAPREWVLSDCIVPSPLLLSVGMNIPELKGVPEEWPFPVNMAVPFAKSLGLDDEQIREVFAGRTILSLGGQNRILWLTLPGVLAEFTGDKRVMREMVDAFWDKFFFGSDLRKLEGLDYGGWINTPFSVIGAGQGDHAVLGLVSPESVRHGGELAKYMQDKEKAVGWFVADMPRLGDALRDMTRLSALLTTKDGESPGFISGDEEKKDSGEGYFFSDLDQGVSDSFARLLKKFGKVSIVWEKPDSGRITWYK